MDKVLWLGVLLFFPVVFLLQAGDVFGALKLVLAVAALGAVLVYVRDAAARAKGQRKRWFNSDR